MYGFNKIDYFWTSSWTNILPKFMGLQLYSAVVYVISLHFWVILSLQ